MRFTWLSQSWWVLQALTCDLDPPSTSDAVLWGWAEGGAAARSSQTGGAARAGVSEPGFWTGRVRGERLRQRRGWR